MQAIFFDIDDTLYNESEFVRSGYEAVGHALRERRGTKEPYEDWLWDRFLAGRASGAMDALNQQFSLGLDDAGVWELVETYRYHRPNITLYVGMERVLEVLHSRVRLGIISDGPSRTQWNKYEALELWRFIPQEHVVISGDLGEGVGKPDPVMFRTARDKLAAQDPDCTYVADNTEKDFITPNQLGWRTIRFQRDGQVHPRRTTPPGGEPHALVQSATDLLDQLGILEEPDG
jgi:putative hydrolase of the HAD superfamily